MIIIKTGGELRDIFGKILLVVDKEIKWEGIFLIYNNILALPGPLRTLIFDFDRKKLSSQVVDVSFDPEKAEKMGVEPLLENIFNMALYAFGKWGQIKGLKVEKNFGQLNQLMNEILAEIDIEGEVSEDAIRFFQEGKQITYEELIQASLDKIQPKEKEENDVEEEYEIGLWHDLEWKSSEEEFVRKNFQGKKKERNAWDTTSILFRIDARLQGKNFYGGFSSGAGISY